MARTWVWLKRRNQYVCFRIQVLFIRKLLSRTIRWGRDHLMEGPKSARRTRRRRISDDFGWWNSLTLELSLLALKQDKYAAIGYHSSLNELLNFYWYQGRSRFSEWNIWGLRSWTQSENSGSKWNHSFTKYCMFCSNNRIQRLQLDWSQRVPHPIQT